ncbi:hypothetical protein MASR2M48_20060 [Spirochaetota bacterium]
METSYDLIILGGGAAGLGAAQYGARANLKTLVIEEMAHGGRTLLIDKLENYPGILEPVDGYTLVRDNARAGRKFGVNLFRRASQASRRMASIL